MVWSDRQNKIYFKEISTSYDMVLIGTINTDVCRMPLYEKKMTFLLIVKN